MNRADNESGSKAIDSLINYETVKVFLNYSFPAELELLTRSQLKVFLEIISISSHTHTHTHTPSVFQ